MLLNSPIGSDERKGRTAEKRAWEKDERQAEQSVVAKKGGEIRGMKRRAMTEEEVMRRKVEHEEMSDSKVEEGEGTSEDDTFNKRDVKRQRLRNHL